MRQHQHCYPKDGISFHTIGLILFTSTDASSRDESFAHPQSGAWNVIRELADLTVCVTPLS
jgi:hypothetical protein